MGMFDWLRHHDRVHVAPQQATQIDEALARILSMNPNLQMARHYRERLTPALATALQYVDGLVASLPAARAANAQTWSSDPCIRAFFATPDDLAKAFGRSEALHAHFERHPDSQEAYAVLGMAMTERHVLGIETDGDTVRHDVPQTTLWFSDHRVYVCGCTEDDLRDHIRRRLIDQLALEGLAKLAADRRELLAHGRTLLQARVALLARQGTGMRSLLGDGVMAEPGELAQVQEQIEENARRLADLSVPAGTTELHLDGICEVMSDAASHLYFEKRSIRIDLMNVVQDKAGPATHEIEFNFARIPGDPPDVRAFALILYPRAELLPGGLNIDAALRGL